MSALYPAGVVMPEHPGETLRRELALRGITQAEFAASIRRPAQAINEIINGKKAITVDTALAFEAELGMEAWVWLYAQVNFELAAARTRRQRRRASGTVRP